jgi:hypothetical protein
MRKTRIGGFVCKGVPVFIEESPVDTLNLSPDHDPTVALGIRDQSMDLDMSDIQSWKRLLNIAEARLRLRQQQAILSRNLTLDL